MEKGLQVVGRSRCTRFGALLLGSASLLVAATLHAEPADDAMAQQWTQTHGPLRLQLRSLVVAPGMDSGQVWDGVGRVPNEVFREMKLGKLRPSATTLIKVAASALNIDALVP